MTKKYKRASLYTQGRNECTIYTLLNILRTQWGIIVKPTLAMKLIASAETAGIFSRKNGAIFRFMYNRFTGWFYKKYDVEIGVDAVDVKGSAFSTGVANGNTYGLGLLYASSWYRTTRADNKITEKEVREFNKEDNKYMGHNHSYKHGYIIESLSSVKDENKIISFPIETLRLAVDNGIYRPTARTLTMNDKKLDFYLREFNKGLVIKNITSHKDKEVIEKALKLRAGL